jgi:hypothetical protein
MISSEVQRTLVKSPPELWAELSDPASLARHLGELGDIRIVRTDPESTVEWAGENIAGTVSIKPSGWGTKVTLSVTRTPAAQATVVEGPAAEGSEADAPAAEEPEGAAQPGGTTPSAATREAAVAEPETAEAPRAVAEPEAAPEPEITPGPETEPAAEPKAAVEPEPVVALEPRRGFFARLFGRRHRREEPTAPAEPAVALAPADQPTPLNAPERTDAPDAFAAVRRVLAPETFATEHPFAAAPKVQPAPAPAAGETPPDTDLAQAASISAELMAAEEAGAEEVTAVLTAVLDRLGAAHHRPFSRA